MITKISANGNSDINMLLVSPPPAAWANAGVIGIRAILVKRGINRQRLLGCCRFGQIRADYSGRGPNCNAGRPFICMACGTLTGPIRLRGQELLGCPESPAKPRLAP